MIIAVASGKGGTGKTTVATSLAFSLAAQPNSWTAPPLFLDCDAEAPNAHLFLKPNFEQRLMVGIPIPEVDETHCTHCGKCAEVCQYHAIAVLGKKVLVFPQLCHGCGSCSANCPEQAIREIPNEIGVLERGFAINAIEFGRGVLHIGEPMAVPVIRQLKQWMLPKPGQTVIIDAPPGTSCPVVAAVHGADFLLLVTEPTPFGYHDLRLALQVARELNIPSGVVINRENSVYPELEAFCKTEGLPVLLRIPFERSIAEGTARGNTLVEIHPGYQGCFCELYRQIQVIGQANTLTKT